MIVIGYQGIGKSTLAQKDVSVIDLESSNFWIDGERCKNWYKEYGNIAMDLSDNGYTVFMSSHKVVRDYIGDNYDGTKVCISPTTALKDWWIARLDERYRQDESDKNYKALMNAYDRYEDNVLELQQDYRFKQIIIFGMDYDLHQLLLFQT